MTDTEADPFDAFETTAAIMGYIFNKFGADGLQELLALIEHSQEGLWRDAEMLADAGLEEAADIVAAVAETAPSERVLHCPFDPQDHCNYESWQASYQRRQKIIRHTTIRGDVTADAPPWR
jgi:hypothetical protein